MILVYLFIAIVIGQRVVEIKIANKNAQWIKRQGGYEIGRSHYPYIVAVHALFFISLLIETTVNNPLWTKWALIPLVIFLLTQFGRLWTIASLGPFWNTRIMILPGANVVSKGPYRFLRHPNYVIVITEIAVLPLLFQAYWTAFIFTIVNAFVLSYRIQVEEHALKELTNYQHVFLKRKRFIPTFDE